MEVHDDKTKVVEDKGPFQFVRFTVLHELGADIDG